MPLAIDQVCMMCGRPIKEKVVEERIDGREYVFDKRECAVTLKKLSSVYGSDFCVSLNSSSS